MWLLGYAAGIILDSKNGIGFHVDRLPIEAEVNVMMNMLYCRSLHLIINARPGPKAVPCVGATTDFRLVPFAANVVGTESLSGTL